MKERPVLMNGAMVQATLRDVDPKTQTRRTQGLDEVNACPDAWLLHQVGTLGIYAKPHYRGRFGAYFHQHAAGELRVCPVVCPLGEPGDRLWVRETWQAVHGSKDFETGIVDDYIVPTSIPKDSADGHWVALYAATDPTANEHPDDRGFGWRPAIHMPRWASRITLEVTGVKVERLQDISEEDARAEGVERSDITGMYHPTPFAGEVHAKPTARQAFESLWKAINGPESWDANPWVWAITFKRIEAQR